jgi:hypothetical protein
LDLRLMLLLEVSDLGLVLLLDCSDLGLVCFSIVPTSLCSFLIRSVTSAAVWATADTGRSAPATAIIPAIALR